MHVHDLMTKDVIVADVSTPISTILSQMTQRRIHQIPVISQPDKHHSSGDLAGIVVLNRIITRELDSTKATAKAVIMSSAKLSPDDTLDRAAEVIVGSNLRAIPVWDGELVGIVSEEDLMRAVGLEGTARDIAKPFISVEENDGIGKVKELMLHKNISRVGVIRTGKPSELIGVVGTLDLTKAIVPGSKSPHSGSGLVSTGKASAEVRSQRDRGYMEAKQIDKATVMNFIHQPPVVDGDEKLQHIIELLRSNEEVIVKLDGELGIITPKDVLRAYLSGRSVALVQIVGLDREEDVLDVARIQQKAAQIIQHIARSAEVQPMKIYVKHHRKQGPKVKYSIKIEFPTSLGLLIISREHGKSDKSYGDLTTVVQRALDELEREARRVQEKFQKPDRAWVSEMRGEKEEGIGLRSRRIRKG